MSLPVDRSEWCHMIIGSERPLEWKPYPSKTCPHRERRDCDCGCQSVMFRWPSENGGHSTTFAGWTGGPRAAKNPGWTVPAVAQ